MLHLFTGRMPGIPERDGSRANLLQASEAEGADAGQASSRHPSPGGADAERPDGIRIREGEDAWRTKGKFEAGAGRMSDSQLHI
jgi:hypothetical protein